MPVLVEAAPVTPPHVNEPEAPGFTWTSPAGRITRLDDFGGEPGGVLVQPGSLGLGMPVYTYYDTTSPTFDGVAVRGHRAEQREISLPIYMWDVTRAEYLRRWRKLVIDLKPKAGAPGTLTIISRSGETRSIRAFYGGGLEGQDDDQAWTMRSLSAVLVLKCPSPYWLGQQVSRTFQIGAQGDFYPYTWPPKVSDSQVLGDLTVTNLGDADSFPVFTILGPISSANLVNVTTGKLISISGGLDEGETMTIDTRETRRTVVVTDSLGQVTNRYGDLSTDSTLWSFVEGANDIALEMPGSDENSALTVSYQERYLTAY